MIKFKKHKLKEARKQRGLTLEQLAKKIGTSKSYIWEIENEPSNISAIHLLKLAQVLGKPCEYFYTGIKTNNTTN